MISGSWARLPGAHRQGGLIPRQETREDGQFAVGAQVDLAAGFIKPGPEDIETNAGPLVSWRREPAARLKEMPRGRPRAPVFTGQGQPLVSIRQGLASAGRQAVTDHVTCQYPRDTATNNWRLQGQDYFRIMAATGHHTMERCKR